MTTESTDQAPALNAARLAHLENKAQVYPPLEAVTRPAVTTREAAFYLNRAEQTLRLWASCENGPLRPLRVYGRLAWPTADLRRLLGVSP